MRRPRARPNLDAGLYNGLDETLDERIHYRIRTPREGGLCGPVILAGPTCDSADILYRRHPYDLPLDLAIGDPLDFLSAGAYTGSVAAVAFNGFPRSAAISSDVDSGQMVGVVGDHEPPAHNRTIKGAARTKMSPHGLVRRRRPGSRSVVSNITEIV